ncbi:autophagy-related protein 27-domain-containing protein [Mycena leptocephala]|nr:autophagy-related protein 27-domain-containing protein [Mycena leptocephala]
MRARFSAILVVSLNLLKSAAAKDHACNFTLNRLEFNLCPLFSGTSTSVSFEEDTPPTHTTHTYAVGLGTPLKRDVTLPSHLQCPEGTWICLTIGNTRPDHPSEPSRILQVVPVAADLDLNPKAKLLAKARIGDLHEPLQVTLHGGLYNHQSQKASFQFHCDHDLDEPTFPKFYWQYNGTHTFSWRTKHACPRALPPGAPGPRPEEPDPDPPATPPADPDADVEYKEPARRASLSTFFVLFLVSLSVFALRIFYPLLLRCGRRLASRSVIGTRGSKIKGFRPSPLSLVQWAAEENPEEYDIDEGFMHTPSDGEVTPLTPNSRATFAASQYGSAG